MNVILFTPLQILMEAGTMTRVTLQSLPYNEFILCDLDPSLPLIVDTFTYIQTVLLNNLLFQESLIKISVMVNN